MPLVFPVQLIALLAPFIQMEPHTVLNVPIVFILTILHYNACPVLQTALVALKTMKTKPCYAIQEVAMTGLLGIKVFLGAFNAELRSMIIFLEISIQVITIVAIVVLIIVLVAIIGVIAIVVLIISNYIIITTIMDFVSRLAVQVFITIQILRAVNHVPLIAEIVFQTIHAKIVCQVLL